MRIDNPFDRKLEAIRSLAPECVVEASVYVTDTLDLCRTSAESVFGDEATPELALEIYDRVEERIELRKGDER
jgi:hypothetical protein